METVILMLHRGEKTMRTGSGQSCPCRVSLSHISTFYHSRRKHAGQKRNLHAQSQEATAHTATHMHMQACDLFRDTASRPGTNVLRLALLHRCVTQPPKYPGGMLMRGS